MAGAGLVERIQPAAQLLGLCQVRLVTDTAIRMLKGEFAKTSFQSDLVERDRSIRRGDHGHDARDGRVIEAHGHRLCEDRNLPDLVAVSGLCAPQVTGSGMQFAVSAIGEAPVTTQATTALAFEEPGQHVHTATLSM